MRAVLPIEAYSDDMVEPFRLGPMTHECEKCGALHFIEELVGQPPHYQICCGNGRIDVESLKVSICPEPLNALLTGADKRARNFRGRIRAYNSALSFVSFGAKVEPLATAGPPVCILHGALYHYSYALDVPANESAKFSQLYLYDHAEATKRRMNFWDDLDESALEDLTYMIEELSPFP